MIFDEEVKKHWRTILVCRGCGRYGLLYRDKLNGEKKLCPLCKKEMDEVTE